MPKFNNKPNECVKTEDGRTVWLSRSVAVTVTVILRTDEGAFVLVGKRGKDCPDEVGKWCLPCGYLDYCETGWEAAQRETWEEVGLDVSKWINEYSQPWFVNTDPSENRQNVSLRYGCFKDVDELPPLVPNNEGEGEEVQDAMWMPVWEVKNNEFAFNHDKAISDFLRKVLN